MISVEVIMLFQASKAPWGCGEVDDMKIGMTKQAQERLGKPSCLTNGVEPAAVMPAGAWSVGRRGALRSILVWDIAGYFVYASFKG